MTVSAQVDHPRAAMLDMLVHEATAFEPSRRPDVVPLRDDLAGWLGETESLPLVKHRLKVATGHLDKIQHREDWQEWLFTQASNRLLDHVNEVPGITSAAGFSSPTQLDERSAYFSPGQAFYVGEEIRDPGSRVGNKAAYLEIGAEITYRGRGCRAEGRPHAARRKKNVSATGFPARLGHLPDRVGVDDERPRPVGRHAASGRLRPARRTVP